MEGKQACIISLGTRLEECKLAAEYNSKNNIDYEGVYKHSFNSRRVPYGCIYKNGNYYLNFI